MNFEDIADAVNDLRKNGYTADELVLGRDEHADLLRDANVAQATQKQSNQTNSGHIGQVAGAGVKVEDISTPIMKGSMGTHVKAIPVLQSNGFVHENVNGHHLVESIEGVSCINCDKDLENLTTPEMKRWAHGYFLSHRCPDHDIDI